MPREFITRLLRKFGNVHVRGVAALASGSGLAYAIGILLAPILSRMYTPSDFGVLSILASITSLLAIIATFRFELAIPVERDEQLILAQVWLPIVTSLLFAAGVAVILAIWGKAWLTLCGLSEALKYWFIIPLGIVVVAWYQTFSYLAIKYHQYPYIAQVKVIQGIGRTGFPIVFGFLFGSMRCCLIGGDLLARYVGAFRLFYLVKYKGRQKGKRPIVPRDLWQRAVEHRKFAFFSMPAALLNNGLFLLPPLLLGTLYTSEVTGYFSFSQRVILGPVLLLSQAIAQVYYGYVADAYHNQSYRRAYVTFLIAFKMLLLIGLVPVVPLLIFGRQIFGVVFGVQWETAGIYAQIMSLALLLQFCVGPLYPALNVIGRQKDIFATNVASLFFLISLSIAVHVFLLSDKIFVLIYSLILFLNYLSLFAFSLYRLRTMAYTHT